MISIGAKKEYITGCNVIKLSKIWDDFFRVKASQVAQISQASHVSRMR